MSGAEGIAHGSASSEPSGADLLSVRDFAPLDRAGAVIGDPAGEEVSFHIRRPAAIVGAHDIWVCLSTADAEDLAYRIQDVTGYASARLIAFAITAFSGAFVGVLFTILYIGAFHS